MKSLLGVDYGAGLTRFRERLLDDKAYPITAKDMEGWFGVSPGQFGRGGDIYFQDPELGQDGQAASLPFEFQDGGIVLKATIDIPGSATGRRNIFDNDSVEWLPDPTLPRPSLNFPERLDLTNTYGGEITQMQLAPHQFVSGNKNRCIAVRY